MLTSTPKYITYWGDGIEASFLEFFTLFSVITEIHSSHIKEQSMIVVLFESRSAFKTYLMCACACIHLWLSVSLKSRGRKGKDSVLKVLNSPEKLCLSCLLRLLSVSLLKLLLLHCDSFKLNQSFHFLLTPLLHLFSLKITDGGGAGLCMHVVLVCVPGWSQIYRPPVPRAGIVAMHHRAKCRTVDWLIDRSIDWLIDLKYCRLNPGSHQWQDGTLPLSYCLDPFITQIRMCLSLFMLLWPPLIFCIRSHEDCNVSRP